MELEAIVRTVLTGMLLAGIVAASLVVPTHRALAQGSTTPGAAGIAESAIGKVMTLAGTVTVEHDTIVVVQAKLTGGPVTARVGDFVYKGDVVQTGSDGKIGITFIDGTSFNLSNNARMVLNEFVYDPKSTSNSSLFSLTKGSFTFVAGALARTGNMKLDTPVATMGIRGTTPHVEISDDGTVKFATLVEENKVTEPQPLRNGGQPSPPATPQRRSRAEALTPEEAAKYNRLFNMDVRICRGC
jgi:hypothetical protein